MHLQGMGMDMVEGVGGGVAQHQPSIFEIVSEKGFAMSLKPAFLHVIKTLAEWVPEGRVPWIYQNFDEIYLVLDALVQSYYFHTRRATLTESFYGLERSLIESRSGSSDSSKKNRLLVSYVLSVMLPYFQGKLEKSRDDYQEGYGRINVSEKLPKIFNDAYQLLMKYYPVIKATIHLANFIYLMKYAFGSARSHDILWDFLGIRFNYVNPQRAKLHEERKAELYTLKSWRNLRSFPCLFGKILGESVLFGVETGSFIVQFLDWWYNDPQKPKVSLGSLPIPPPPAADKDQNVTRFSDAEKNKCPLCRKPFRNPTAVSVSGIVYCFGCILPHVQSEGKCPVTSLPIRLENLVRLYIT